MIYEFGVGVDDGGEGCDAPVGASCGAPMGASLVDGTIWNCCNRPVNFSKNILEFMGQPGT